MIFIIDWLLAQTRLSIVFCLSVMLCIVQSNISYGKKSLKSE